MQKVRPLQIYPLASLLTSYLILTLAAEAKNGLEEDICRTENKKTTCQKGRKRQSGFKSSKEKGSKEKVIQIV